MNNLPVLYNLPVTSLASAFNQTTNSYKLYWFYAILQILKKQDQPIITFDEITTEMIASTWYTINYFKISFGKQDKLRQAVASIRMISNLAEDASPQRVAEEIRKQLKENKKVQKIIAEFHRYVPYRFLSPFFAKELRGKKDSVKNELIRKEAAETFSLKENFPLYRFAGVDSIELHPTWMAYFKKQIAIVEGFTLWNLTQFLQKRNPNIPNIGGKIFWRPQQRDLKKARKFWYIYSQERPMNCIFSNQNIDPTNFAIDHFIPWSFLTHDLLWNLIPIEQSVNSSKNNCLPELDTYFDKFSTVQFDAFHLLYKKQKRLLEDYAILFHEELDQVVRFSKSAFSEKLYQHIAPSIQIAANAGFSQGWIYTKRSL